MVQLDESAKKEMVVDRPMSKMEIFDKMATQNPALKMLRESLNLQID